MTSFARRTKTWLILVACALAAAALHPSAAAAPGEDRLQRLQDAIAAGFTRADAGQMETVFSVRMKTYVACAPLGVEDGYYGADQMQILLRRLFRGRSTERFQILERDERARADGLAVVTALWSYRQAGSPPAEIRFAFTIAPEADAWHVREIRDMK
jgi:hypothetical protein